MRACLLSLFALTACGGADPELADPPSLPTPPTPDDTADTGPDPAWVAAIVPPTDVTAACWHWAVNWDVAFEEPRYLFTESFDRDSMKVLTYGFDTEPDGLWDSLNTYAWDATFENLTRVVYDDDGDGVPSRILEQEFDANGDRVAWRNDIDADGTFDEVWTYHLVDGDLVTAETDEDGDGQFDVWWSYTYDAQGRPLHFQGDRGNDGSVDSRVDYVHDDTVTEGRAYTRIDDMVLDGVPEVRQHYRFDAEDQLVYEEWEVPTARMERTSTWNADGTRAGEIQEYWFDGAWNDRQTATWTYDAEGREIREDRTVSFAEDDSIQYTDRTDTTWFCP